MRRVTNIEEVNSALRELFAVRDELLLENVDWHQRRIVNAHPSVDDYDYVVRKELIDTIGEFKTPRAARGSSVVAANYDKITFGLGVGTPVVTGDYGTPPFGWTNSRQGRPSYAIILANIPPTGADFRFVIKKNDVTILTPAYATFPAGTAARVVVPFTSSLASTTIARGDVITPHVTQVGSIVPGQDITIVIYCDLL